MPYVDIVKDFSGVPRKIVLGMTKRQLISVIIAAVIGMPFYFISRPFLGISAMFLMIALMVPPLLIGFYPVKDGVPVEKRMANYIKARYIRPAKRPYRTETIYSRMELAAKIQEVIDDATAERENKESKKTGSIQRTAKKRKKKDNKAR